MPHQCTECGHTFPDGSTEMLSGCPDCGGNKFQYFPGEVPDNPPEEEPPEPADAGMSGTMGKAARTVRDFVGSSPDSPGNTDDPPTPMESSSTPETDRRSDSLEAPDDQSVETPDHTTQTDSVQTTATPKSPATTQSDEDDAQRAARSEVVDSDDLPDPDSAQVIDRPSGEQPDMAELREELNDQFESIRIVEPGQYELNLMELYDREEYIIALQENGRYVIEVPDAWHDDH